MKREKILRKKVIKALKKQGFKINPHVRPRGYSKKTLRQIQQNARMEQISFHKKFLLENTEKVISYCKDGKEIDPDKIVLELREVKSGSLEEILFRWWNLTWWSIPYQHPYGRQMRFLLWDITHNCPFGLFALQSPVLKMSVRDNALGIPNKELDIWVNRSMNAQRVGALPPYNELLGGKMVALALTSNEIREAYIKKYKNYVSIIERRRLRPELLFITTTSAFGRSSLYNRLKLNGEVVAESLGYTKGSGTFHIPEDLYQEILEFLASKSVDIARGYGHGPSRKLKLLSLGFKYLGIPKFEFHGLKREFYLLPLVKNLKDVIQRRKKPIWYNRPFNRLVEYWKGRWAIPRAKRIPLWSAFETEKFFIRATSILKA
ncbi:MAG: hypothetical protein RBG1_1C00001G0458 [candidate division Zixibacteria bacterium RBG-1]|nr:MAG: hypothetical protein RBG1_1C00001G0458 [candidate division Zixibacteria bacterium RBG-1]OGC83447.1 MAG: hypothetical protein A2V73_01725 [candidate division Zixibacteria bacterium RBG_19FT_COMBO_42_43]